jgi:hypothetical protein
MHSSRRPVAARCLEIRERLRDFAAERLGPTATGEVQGHLLSCQDCSEVFGEILQEEVDSGAVPLLTPPWMPPISWYDDYMRVGSSSFGTFWTSIRNAVQAADAKLQNWGNNQIAQLAAGLQALAPVGGAVRTRGAVRVRGAAIRTLTLGGSAAPPASPDEISAEVISAAGESTGEGVRFAIAEGARITNAHRFTLKLTTGNTTYDSEQVICTVSLPKPPSRPEGTKVSFVGTITHREGQTLREVRIDEPDVPGPARIIPRERITLTVIAS